MGVERRPLSRRSVWTAKAGAIVGFVLYVVVVRWLAPLISSAGGHAPVGVGIVLALVPSLLWLALFYVQDAQEPEPLADVFRVGAAGMILAAAVAIPLVRSVYRVSEWLYASPLVTLLGSVLVVAAIQEWCKFAAVRYTVLESPEFDHVGDGVGYGIAAGLGVATILNLVFVLEGPTVAIVPATLRIVVTCLAHAAFGGIIGYFLGREKETPRTAPSILWGYLIAVGLNGVFRTTLGAIVRTGLVYRPWNGLVLATVLAVVVIVLLFRLARPEWEMREA